MKVLGKWERVSEDNQAWLFGTMKSPAKRSPVSIAGLLSYPGSGQPNSSKIVLPTPSS